MRAFQLPLFDVLERHRFGVELTVVGQRIAVETLEAAQHAALMELAVAFRFAQIGGAVVRLRHSAALSVCVCVLLLKYRGHTVAAVVAVQVQH